MTATYWLIGRHIVEFEQRGKIRAEYGAESVKRLAADLSARYGRGFSKRNLEQMRLFYMSWPIAPTVSAQSGTEGRSDESPQKAQTLSAQLTAAQIGIEIAPEDVGLLFAEIGLDAADSDVHHSEVPASGIVIRSFC